jgi:alpha-N-arabinofuranosidase
MAKAGRSGKVRGLLAASASVALLALAACGGAPQQAEAADAAAKGEARFAHFRYTGRDPVFEAIPEGFVPNPILAGFYPDPAVTQVGNAYYLVNSTFSWFPGIPVFRSTDLVNWEQVGNAIDRPGMLDFDGLGLFRGVFAPTITHHEGVFYIANTCVDCGGNVIITASDPAGPWSDPVFIPQVGGIDPSVFFDVDGKMYLMNNDMPPEGARYEGHRAIWIREIDPKTFQPVAEPSVIINGGVRPEENPIWIEGPHIYRIGEWYYFSCAEGGTSLEHSQVILRSKSVLGPYEAYADNPILTQRDLPDDRANPVTALGHADLVQDAKGDWWAVFLGIRPYEVWHHNTGRETFLAPVTWRDGWPVILERGKVLGFSVPRPAGVPMPADTKPMSGNFTVEYGFDGGEIGPEWITPRVPKEVWYRIADGQLVITGRPVALSDAGQPSLLARRLQHHHSETETEIVFAPGAQGDEAGLVAYHDDFNYLALGVGLDAQGQREIRLTLNENKAQSVLARAPLAGDPAQAVGLKITTEGRDHAFAYQVGDGEWAVLADRVDGRVLSMERVEGFSFTGVVLGLYAVAGK